MTLVIVHIYSGHLPRYCKLVKKWTLSIGNEQKYVHHLQEIDHALLVHDQPPALLIEVDHQARIFLFQRPQLLQFLQYITNTYKDQLSFKPKLPKTHSSISFWGVMWKSELVVVESIPGERHSWSTPPPQTPRTQAPDPGSCRSSPETNSFTRPYGDDWDEGGRIVMNFCIDEKFPPFQNEFKRHLLG